MDNRGSAASKIPEVKKHSQDISLFEGRELTAKFNLKGNRIPAEERGWEECHVSKSRYETIVLI